MSETIWLGIIAGLPATITALASLIVSWRGRARLGEQQRQMHEENTEAILQNREAVKELDRHLNGNLERIVAGAVTAALANERLEVSNKKK